MALAALRVGYLLASPELVTEIRKAVLPLQPECVFANCGGSSIVILRSGTVAAGEGDNQ
jgi:hypothetical protein